MSTVVGLKYKDSVWIGSDSLASTEDGEIRPFKGKKIIRNGLYLIGFVGSIRGGQILLPEYFKPPKNIYDFPDSIKEQCEKKGCLGVTDDQMSVHACNYLVGYNGRLFEILIDFQMNELDSYVAIGSGSSYAFGSLYTTESIENLATYPIERIELALMAASKFSATTGGEIVVEKL